MLGKNFTSVRYGWLLGLLAGAYACLFGLQFLADPLGQVPVLDARENLAWAERIANGTLPAEPMYRALLYPWLLSWLPPSLLPATATLLGIMMHGLSAWLVALIAGRLWQQTPAARLAGCIYAIYPVALYFAGQVLDITLATTLFMAAVYSLLVGADSVSKRRALLWALGAGLLAGLAVLARPNFLPAVLWFPFAMLFFKVPDRLLRGLCLAAGLVGTLGIQGGVNYKLSGEVRFLPWQGVQPLRCEPGRCEWAVLHATAFL